MSKTKEDLFVAIKNCNINEVLQCLNDGVDVDEFDSNGFSPLMQACGAYDVSEEKRKILLEIIELLILRGAEINKKGVKYYTPLHSAARDFPAAIDILIEHKADVNIKDNNEETPLSIAVFVVEPAGVKRLLDNKADPTLIKPRASSTPAGGMSFGPGHKVIRQLLEEAKRTQPVSSLNKM